MKAKLLPFVLLVAAAGFVGGYGYGRWYGKKPEAAAQPAGRRVLYWVDPMHPAYKSDRPGIAPDCGMQLEPVYADQAPPPAAAPGAVQVSPEKLQLIGVRYGTVEHTTDAETVRATGKVAVDETRITRVHAKTDGWIEQVFVNFTGQAVAKGQSLLTLYSPELLASQQEYLLALKARDTLAASTVPGVRADTNALVEAARRRLALWDLTDAQIDEIRRRGQPVKSVTLYSPGVGYVTARNAFPSQRITPETDLYTLVDLSRIWVLASVFEYEAPLVRVGQPAVVSLPYQPGRNYRARVSNIQPQVDAATRTLQVRLELANPGLALKPDMYVEVQLEAAQRTMLTVPAEAVLDSGLRQTVFVDLGGGAFEPRRIETGRRIGKRIEILKGVAHGERVVTSGNFLISSESQLKAAAAETGGHQPPQAPQPAPPARPAEHRHD
jgi:RND family efflux transporter MFP subunit